MTTNFKFNKNVTQLKKKTDCKNIKIGKENECKNVLKNL